ncbi:hypothetical protein FRX31_012859 [Thalictrum thalictroides]|uniref:Uncharacterized protein n=1 Tax=Thalictrum thalictroides TaxID=46969 RepID=A0A7J6WJJ7_THATH|nr:hypothetical protein FRX31_012859 [Thalictrum thalictroides]
MNCYRNTRLVRTHELIQVSAALRNPVAALCVLHTAAPCQMFLLLPSVFCCCCFIRIRPPCSTIVQPWSLPSPLTDL